MKKDSDANYLLRRGDMKIEEKRETGREEEKIISQRYISLQWLDRSLPLVDVRSSSPMKEFFSERKYLLDICTERSRQAERERQGSSHLKIYSSLSPLLFEEMRNLVSTREEEERRRLFELFHLANDPPFRSGR